MKTLLVYLLIFSNIFISNGQSSISNESNNEMVSFNIFTKCFKNLNHGCEILEKHPELNKIGFCSIQKCITLLAYKEKEIQDIGKARLKGIAIQLYKEGIP